jgi:hypothetical protein
MSDTKTVTDTDLKLEALRSDVKVLIERLGNYHANHDSMIQKLCECTQTIEKRLVLLEDHQLYTKGLVKGLTAISVLTIIMTIMAIVQMVFKVV